MDRAPLTIDSILQAALAHHQAGRLAEAEAGYRQVLAREPRHADALHLLGVLAGQVGRGDAAVDLIGRAIAVNPPSAEFHNSLGVALRTTGRLEEAIAALRQAVTLKPQYAEAHSNLGNVLRDAGRVPEAILACRKAIELRPDSAMAHNNLGVALKRNEDSAAAVNAFHDALNLMPDYLEARVNLGHALRDEGKLDEAIAEYRRAIEIDPGNADLHDHLGVALRERGKAADAILALREALRILPDHADAHSHLGTALKDTGQLDAAIAACQRAVELRPESAIAYNNLGVALRDQSRLDEALACFRKAIELKPDAAAVHSNLLLTLGYHPRFDAQAILQEHQQWARQHADPLAAEIRPHENDRAPARRLRIGYVSPDLRTHPVGGALLPVLAHHDPQQVEVICYSDAANPDAMTARLRPLAHLWRDTSSLSDAQLARQIRRDRIDILVDLALHTAGNRLRVFARKPAPVQVTWLGYPGTTGLRAIDYRLTDPYMDPPGQGDEFYTEQSIRLPHSFWCYRPIVEAPPVNELPARRNGLVTFGCFNNFAKVTDAAQFLWARVLQAVPNSRLLLLAPAGETRLRVRRRFEGEGVAVDRLEFVDRGPFEQYFRLHHRVDLCLDPIPYPGQTTGLDGLWMGVPAVTLAGSTAASRGGVTLLANLGLTHWIAHTPEEYVSIAATLAGDLPGLSDLRASLRQRMQQSPLSDARQFAADLEAIFRRIWKTWACGPTATR